MKNWRKSWGALGALVCFVVVLMLLPMALSACGTDADIAAARAARVKAADLLDAEASKAAADAKAREDAATAQIARLTSQVAILQQTLNDAGSAIDAATRQGISNAQAAAQAQITALNTGVADAKNAAAAAASAAKSERDEIAAIDAQRDQEMSKSTDLGLVGTLVSGLADKAVPGLGMVITGGIAWGLKGVRAGKIISMYKGELNSQGQQLTAAGAQVTAASKVVSAMEQLKELEPAFAQLIEKNADKLSAHMGPDGKAFVDAVQAVYSAPAVIATPGAAQAPLKSAA